MPTKVNTIFSHPINNPSQVYFIKKGQVALVLRKYNNFKFRTISQGYYFGEVELLFEEIRKYTYMAETDCDLLCISK